MAKCKDCLHMELCARDERLPDFTPEQEALCQFFVDRSRYVVREKGEWEFSEYERMRWCTKAVCSRCKSVIANNVHLSETWGLEEFVKRHNFCPNCGADMRRRENG